MATAADVSYVPGTLTAVTGDQCWALVEVAPDSPAVTRIWQQLGQGAAVDALLAGLLADGIGGTPGFALLVAGPGGKHRLFCRGAVGATVVTGPVHGSAPPGSTRADERRAAAERMDGAGLLTWREQLVDNAERIFLGEPPADTDLRLPATSGVLLAGCVIIELTNLATRETVPYAPEDPGKSVVFPDTITMTHPGSLIGRDSAASAAAAKHPPDDRGPMLSPAPPLPFPAGPAGPPAPPGTPRRPDAPASGAFPAPVMPPAVPASVMPSGVPASVMPYGVPAPGMAPVGPAPVMSSGVPAPVMPPSVPASVMPSGGPATGMPTAALPPVTPTAAGPTVPFGGPVPAGVPAGPGAVAGPGPSDVRNDDDEYHDFRWGGPSRTVADGAIRSAERSDPAPLGPFPAGGPPVPGAYSGTGPQSPAQYPGAPPQPVTPWQTVPDGAWAEGPRQGTPLSGPMRPPAPMPARAPAPPGGGLPPNGLPPNGMSPGPAGGLIDVPPWLSGPSGPAPAVVIPAGAARAEPPYQPPASSAESGHSESRHGESEHIEFGHGESGSTVKRVEVSELVARTTPPDRIGPVVPALICPSGHVNPPSGAACRRCGAPLPHDPVPVPRPVLGVLRLSLGDVITLDRGVLMGRNPRTDFGGPDGFAGPGGEERPHVVKLPSADGDISRTHLRVALDGWHVLVTDLNSTNGTLVTLPGRDTQQLRPGEPVPIQPGTVVTLADGIDFRYEVTN